MVKQEVRKIVGPFEETTVNDNEHMKIHKSTWTQMTGLKSLIDYVNPRQNADQTK